MAEVVSIHRAQDFHLARRLADHLRLKLRLPASSVTDTVVERLADMLQQERVWRQGELERGRAEMAAAYDQINAEMARTRAIFDAMMAYLNARKALNEVLRSAKPRR